MLRFPDFLLPFGILWERFGTLSCGLAVRSKFLSQHFLVVVVGQGVKIFTWQHQVFTHMAAGDAGVAKAIRLKDRPRTFAPGEVAKPDQRVGNTCYTTLNIVLDLSISFNVSCF